MSNFFSLLKFKNGSVGFIRHIDIDDKKAQEVNRVILFQHSVL